MEMSELIANCFGECVQTQVAPGSIRLPNWLFTRAIKVLKDVTNVKPNKFKYNGMPILRHGESEIHVIGTDGKVAVRMTVSRETLDYQVVGK